MSLIIAQFRGERFTATHGVKYKAEINHIHGNRLPYFSITGTTYERAKLRYGGECWSERGSGCVHQDIAAMFPQDMFVQSMIALHLSTFPDGVPMHAVANGFYWYERGEIDTLASHLRLPVTTLMGMRAVETQEQFAEVYVEPQRARWKAEALALWKSFQSFGAVNQRGVEQARKYYNFEIPL